MSLFGTLIIKMSEERGIAAQATNDILGLSASLIYLTDTENESDINYVRLTWNFADAVSLIDWIGLFRTGEHNPLLYMDYKNYGVCGSKSGSVDWKLTGSDLGKHKDHVKFNFDDKHDQQDINNNSVCFKYYDGLVGAVRATSPPLLVYSDAQILVSSIICKNLRAHRGGSYYAKISYSATRTCAYRTGYAANASWTDLKFLFPADRSGELRFAIKERRWNGDQTLGLLNIPIIDLVQRRNQNLAFVLRTPSSSDINNNHPCQIVVSCRLIPQQKESYTETINSLAQPSDELSTCREHNGSIYDCLPNTANSLKSMMSAHCTISPSSSNEMNSSVNSGVPSTFVSSDLTSSLAQSSFNSLVSISNLPKGWEVRVDRYGRLIYIDHVNKRTTWHPPAILDNEPVRCDQRYICARRTILKDRNVSENQSNKSKRKSVGNGDGGKDQKNAEKPKVHITPDSDLPRGSTCAGLHFLQREDFPIILQTNAAALNLYNESTYLKHIIHRIRKEPTKFFSFERNRELVKFINLFADKTQPLPQGWQTAKHCDREEQRLFIDHKSKQITLIDPRLPELMVRRRTKSAPPSNRHVVNSSTRRSGCDIWDLIHHTDELQAIVTERFPEMASKLCKKLQLIERLGEVALLRLANDVDFVTALSAIERYPKLPATVFEEKLDYFYTSLQKAGYGQGPAKIHFRLRRSHLVTDAFDKILAMDSNKLRNCQMSVTFDEEDGLDYGGPSRELFFLLSRDLFNPYYGLFEYSANDTYTVQISPISKFVDNYLQWMELCGRVLGLALIHRCMIDTFFTRAFYKFLLRIPYTISDLQAMDSQFHNSLLWIREHQITSDLDLTFSVTEEVGGQIIEKELLPDGKNISVTESNKEEYIILMLRWRAERSVGAQGQALLRGLYSVIPPDYLRIFNGEQLELVLSGTMEIDIDDWQENTEYKGGYYNRHIVVNWFWQTVHSFNNADRLKLLQFVTGTSSVPYEGFKSLRGSNGPKKFTIERWGTEDSLPRAHTCFNRLDLPSYPTQKILKEKLKLAIYESSCYSIE